MTETQTIKVLELLNAFYAGGKNDPKQQVVAWHLILRNYDFEDAMSAVLTYARNDRREYAQFPTVGRIIEEIENVQKMKDNVVREVIRAISYGKAYDDMSVAAKRLIHKERYNEYLTMDAVVFAEVHAPKLTVELKTTQKNLLEAKGRVDNE